MALQDLVQAVAGNEFYLRFKSPRDQRILETLLQVDRKQFLPDYEDKGFVIDPELVLQLKAALISANVQAVHDAAREVVDAGKCYTISLQGLAYNDIALPIGYNQTCSQPSMVAFMCDVLDLRSGMRVLEIGTGCGYHAAVTSELVGETGHVVSVERIPQLAELSLNNLRNHFGESMEKRITLITADGSSGVPTTDSFDRIYFTAAVCREKFDPIVFASHLNRGGILLYPETKGSLVREVYDCEILKNTQSYGPVVFVPLYGANGGNGTKKYTKIGK